VTVGAACVWSSGRDSGYGDADGRQRDSGLRDQHVGAHPRRHRVVQRRPTDSQRRALRNQSQRDTEFAQHQPSL